MLEKLGCSLGHERVPSRQLPWKQKALAPQSESMAHCTGVTPPTQPSSANTKMSARGGTEAILIGSHSSGDPPFCEQRPAGVRRRGLETVPSTTNPTEGQSQTETPPPPHVPRGTEKK